MLFRIPLVERNKALTKIYCRRKKKFSDNKTKSFKNREDEEEENSNFQETKCVSFETKPKSNQED